MNKLILWLFLWGIIWLIYFFMDKTLNINFTKRFIIPSIYFFLVSIGTLSYFFEDYKILIPDINYFPIVLFILGIFLNIYIYIYVNTKLKKPKKFINKNKDIHALTFDYRYLVSKSFEVLFQQCYIWLLIIWLTDFGYNIEIITLLFIAMFGLTHLGLFFLISKKFALLLFIFSIFASIYFPILILKVNYGFLYSYLIHITFYTLLGFSFWTIKHLRVL